MDFHKANPLFPTVFTMINNLANAAATFLVYHA
jgi:hypothetical protein